MAYPCVSLCSPFPSLLFPSSFFFSPPFLPSFSLSLLPLLSSPSPSSFFPSLSPPLFSFSLLPLFFPPFLLFLFSPPFSLLTSSLPPL
ncbi:hypothetical protein ACXWRW_09815, partial [Streptococcus pyogenes]